MGVAWTNQPSAARRHRRIPASTSGQRINRRYQRRSAALRAKLLCDLLDKPGWQGDLKRFVFLFLVQVAVGLLRGLIDGPRVH